VQEPGRESWHGRRMVVARSNCSRIAVESYCSCNHCLTACSQWPKFVADTNKRRRRWAATSCWIVGRWSTNWITMQKCKRHKRSATLVRVADALWRWVVTRVCRVNTSWRAPCYRWTKTVCTQLRSFGRSLRGLNSVVNFTGSFARTPDL